MRLGREWMTEGSFCRFLGGEFFTGGRRGNER